MVKRSLLAGALMPAMGLIGNGAEAVALPLLDPNDPQAKSLGYAPDGSKVNAAANPTFKPSQKCSTCAQYQGKATDATAGCNILPATVYRPRLVQSLGAEAGLIRHS